jgi:hypothetical protein
MDGYEEVAKKILAIIKQEQDQRFWRRLLSYTCGKMRGGSPTTVQIPIGSQQNLFKERSTQASIHEAIWANIHYKRRYLAKEAPICQGQLRLDFCL